MAKGMLYHLGRVCRDCRTRAGATQLDVAVRAGVSHAAVSRFETGRSTPKVGLDRMVRAYARECGTTPKALWAAAIDALNGT